MRPSSHVRTAALCLSLAVVAAAGCDRGPVPEPESGPPVGPSTGLGDGTDELDALGKGVAVALADGDLRRQVLRDLRDSPFPEHALHLKSYLRGEDGSRIAAAAADAVGMEERDFLALLDGVPSMQFYMPSPYQQATWKGELPLAVLATDATREERRSMRSDSAWTTAGEKISLPLYEPPGRFVLAIVPAEHRFGDDPEATRRASPAVDRPTIENKGFVPRHAPDRPEASGRPLSASGQSRGGSLLTGGTSEVHLASLVGGPGAARGDGRSRSLSSGYELAYSGYEPGGAYLSSSVTWSNCVNVASGDEDADDIRDGCEYELAHAFRPIIWFDFNEELEARQSYWAVQQADNVPELSIFYAPAYYDDATHAGDSEFIWLTVEYVDGRWYLNTATYSAHWRSCCNDRTATYSYTDLEWPDRHRGKPAVYASENKHANYNTESECDTLAEDCGSAFGEEMDVLEGRNLGEAGCCTDWGGRQLVDCVASSRSYSNHGHALDGTECFWSDGDSFDGWHNYSDDILPYRESLDYWDYWLRWEYGADDDGGTNYDECTDDPNARKC